MARPLRLLLGASLTAVALSLLADWKAWTAIR